MNLKPIVDGKDFEYVCCEVAREVFGDFAALIYGRSGQSQGGRDIFATDRRGTGDKIVIQCKFKHDPKNISIEVLKNEFKDELEAAIARHTFDHFIFATTYPRDTHLQDYAAELSVLKNVKVLCWSMNELADYVKTYPRLQRLFAIEHASYGVELIDSNFVNSLAPLENSFDFYCGFDSGLRQWRGIAHGLHVVRDAEQTVAKRITDLFSKLHLDSKIAAVIKGEGGAGKSSFLRSLAVQFAKEKEVVCWWVTSIDEFLEHVANSIVNTPQQKHLIFIEDWYRNAQGPEGKAFLTWLAPQRSTLVVVGDRPSTTVRAYMRKVYAGVDGVFDLASSENTKIIEGVLHKIGGIGHLGGAAALLEKSASASLFVSLFVLAHLAKNREVKELINFDDGVVGKFKDIIAKYLTALDAIPGYGGFKDALRLAAELYSDEQSQWKRIDTGLLPVAAAHYCLSIDPLAAACRDSDEEMPSELKALIDKFDLKTAQRFRFNHDVIAEIGIVSEPHLLDKSNAKKLTRLLGKLRDAGALYAAQQLWCWLAYNKIFESDQVAEDELFEICVARSGFFSSNSLAIAKAFQTEERVASFIKRVLYRPELILKLGPEFCAFWRRNGLEKEARSAAAQLLAMPYFMGFPHQIIDTALTLLQKGDPGKWDGRKILKAKSFLSLTSHTKTTALTLLVNDEVGKEGARQVLTANDFMHLPYQFVCAALTLRANDEVGKESARQVLAADDLTQSSPYIVSTAFKLLVNAGAGKEGALQILKSNNFQKLPHPIVCAALKLLANEEQGKACARQILAAENLAQTSGRINTFLAFSALRVAAKSQDERAIDAANVFVNRLFAQSPGEQTKAQVRLRHDVLYLPYYSCEGYAHSLRWVARSYGVDASFSIKRDVFKIFRCQAEYGAAIGECKDVIEGLAYRVIEQCAEDTEHQWLTHANDLNFGHITTAFELLPNEARRIAEAKRMLSELGLRYPQLQSRLALLLNENGAQRIVEPEL